MLLSMHWVQVPFGQPIWIVLDISFVWCLVENKYVHLWHILHGCNFQVVILPHEAALNFLPSCPGIFSPLLQTDSNVCVILESEIVWNKFCTGTGFMEPLAIHFPEYSKGMWTMLFCAYLRYATALPSLPVFMFPQRNFWRLWAAVIWAQNIRLTWCHPITIWLSVYSMLLVGTSGNYSTWWADLQILRKIMLLMKNAEAYILYFKKCPCKYLELLNFLIFASISIIVIDHLYDLMKFFRPSSIFLNTLNLLREEKVIWLSLNKKTPFLLVFLVFINFLYIDYNLYFE